MQTQRERFEAYYKLPGAKNPEHEQVVLAAADAFDAALADGEMSAEQLRVIVEAASHSSAKIWMNCYTLLADASEHWTNAAAAITEMSHGRLAHVRFNAICCLSEKTPANVVDDVLRRGLVDRSARVRRKAADQAMSLSQRHLIPEMAAAAEREVHEETKDSITFDLHFLKDGYLVKRNDDGSYSISVQLFDPPGGTGVDVSEEEFVAKGVETIVAEVRKQRSDLDRQP